MVVVDKLCMFLIFYWGMKLVGACIRPTVRPYWWPKAPTLPPSKYS